jgi:hypothetical protein
MDQPRIKVLALTNSEGKQIWVPKELLAAFEYFLNEPTPSGSMTVHFKHGHVAGVETLVRQIMK